MYRYAGLHANYCIESSTEKGVTVRPILTVGHGVV